jgi:hypothetical protein
MFDRFLTLGWRTLSHFIKYVSRNLDRTPKSVRSATSTRRLIQKLEFSLLRVVFLERIVLLDPAAYAAIGRPVYSFFAFHSCEFSKRVGDSQ